MNISDIEERVRGIRGQLQKWAGQAFSSSKGEVKTLVQDQLWDGIRADGSLLRPLYTEDTYFRSRKQMDWYVKWKNRITPNANRPSEAPNLFISGRFYSELRVDAGETEMEVTGSTSFSRGIVSKYKKESFGLTDAHLSGLVERVILPYILRKMRE